MFAGQSHGQVADAARASAALPGERRGPDASIGLPATKAICSSSGFEPAAFSRSRENRNL